MATPEQLATLQRYYSAAKASEHIFPAMAACEAVLESAWGTSELARDYANLFGQKCPVLDGIPSPPDGALKVTLPTREWVGEWITINAVFLWFTSEADAFTHRMLLLMGGAGKYPNYAAALHAPDAESYVTAVSKTWATDPHRAENCIAIYRAHADLLQGVTA